MKKMILAAFVAAMMCVNASAQSFDGAEFVDNGEYFAWVDADGNHLTSILKETARMFGWDGVTTPFYWDRDGNISYSEATAADNGEQFSKYGGATFVERGDYFEWITDDGCSLCAITKPTARMFGWDGVTTPFYWDRDGNISYSEATAADNGVGAGDIDYEGATFVDNGVYLSWVNEDGMPVFSMTHETSISHGWDRQTPFTFKDKKISYVKAKKAKKAKK